MSEASCARGFPPAGGYQRFNGTRPRRSASDGDGRVRTNIAQQHRTLIAGGHFEASSGQCRPAASPLTVCTARCKWHAGARRAGTVGGAYAHQLGVIIVPQGHVGSPAAVRFLEFLLLDPMNRALATAPVEDEEISEEEEQAVARSKEWFQHNEGIPFDQVVAELGFIMEQIRDHRLDQEKDSAA